LEILRKQGLDVVNKKPTEKTKPDSNQNKITADE
jgi:hypothetical protein